MFNKHKQIQTSEDVVYHSDVILGTMSSQPASHLFTQPFIQIKENIKAPRHWPLWSVNSPQKGPVQHWGRDKMANTSQTTLWIAFFNEIIGISITISLKFVPMGPINNIPALNQIMAWRRPGDKPLFKQMLVIEFTDTCARHSASVYRVVFHAVRILVMHKTEIATFAEMPPSWANHVLINAICG